MRSPSSEAGQLSLALADYSLKAVVYTAVEQLAKEKKLGFKVEVAPDLPTGHGDERRLTQVLLNLVGNAIKFTDQGEISRNRKRAAAYSLILTQVTGKKHPKSPRFSTLFKGLARDPKIPSCIY